MSVLTQPTLEPEFETRRRRREDTTRGFVAGAGELFRRLIRRPAFDILTSQWDTFTWLRIWDCNDPTCMNLYEHSVRGERQFDDELFPHL